MSVRDDDDSDTTDETDTGTDTDDFSLSSDDDLGMLPDVDELLYQQMMEVQLRRERERDMFGGILGRGAVRRYNMRGLGRPGLGRLAAGRLLAREREDRVCSEDRSGRKCTVYFTKNGEKVGERECDVPKGGFYPVVAMLSKGERIRVNLNPITG